jgi:F-type H+-transporting ATPase subunit epsilon
LGVGEIMYRMDRYVHYVAAACGFAEVLPHKVSILAETAERAEEIDVTRADRAKKRAEERLQRNDPSVNYARAQRALARAATPLQVAKRQRTAKSRA